MERQTGRGREVGCTMTSFKRLYPPAVHGKERENGERISVAEAAQSIRNAIMKGRGTAEHTRRTSQHDNARPSLPCLGRFYQHAVDLRQEDPENTVVRMLSLLRVLKYRPNMAPACVSGGRKGLGSRITSINRETPNPNP